MSTINKKYLYKSQDDDDFESLLTPCLQISRDVELKDTPTTGEEYILKVMHERKRCAVITKCDKDYSKLAKNQTYFAEELPSTKTAPDKLKPTIEWQNIQAADFSDIRMYISRLLSKKTAWPGSVKNIELERNSIQDWKNFFASNEPTLSCVLGLKYTLLDKGLQVLTGNLSRLEPGETIDYKTGLWIYAFLACIRQPLLSDTISILRDLARKCAEIRAHINQDNEDAAYAVAPLNIFICLVSRYFRQYDLAD